MHASPLTAAVTLLIVLILFGTAARVGLARKRHGIIAPTTTGHPAFERAYRVQMNTLEWAVMTLPCLWLAAAFASEAVAAGLGLMWCAGRVWYALAYLRDPGSRGAGFLLAALAFGALGVMAAFGVGRALLGG